MTVASPSRTISVCLHPGPQDDDRLVLPHADDLDAGLDSVARMDRPEVSQLLTEEDRAGPGSRVPSSRLMSEVTRTPWTTSRSNPAGRAASRQMDRIVVAAQAREGLDVGSR